VARRAVHRPASEVAKAFGFSRVALYQALAAFQKEGLSGLLPRRRGPKAANKLTDAVLEFIDQQRAADGGLRAPALATCGGAAPGGYVTLTALGLKAAGIDIQPWNAGCGGNRSREMLARLQRDVLANKPDWVLLNCGVNDSNRGEYGVPADEFRANVTKIIEQSQAAGAKVMILPATGGWEEFAQIMRDLAKQKNCALADVRAPYQQGDKDNPFAQNANDGVHPNARGYYHMTMPILQAFALDEVQLTKARNALLDQPGTFEYQPWFQVHLTLRQMQALNELARKKRLPTDQVLRLLFAADLLPDAPTRTPAEIDAYLDYRKDKDPWAASQQKFKQRLDALLSE
jgi:lysophospholipase L1-like esterase